MPVAKTGYSWKDRCSQKNNYRINYVKLIFLEYTVGEQVPDMLPNTLGININLPSLNLGRYAS